MAVLWIAADDGEWLPTRLAEQAMELSRRPPEVFDPSAERSADQVLLLMTAEPVVETWVVLSQGPGFRINGLRIASGIRALEDRDEIRISGLDGVFFSTESLAEIVAFREGDRPVACGRCREVISEGTPAVRCPGCGVWHHQSEEFPCWTYAERCACCEQATDLGTGYRWTPDKVSGTPDGVPR